MAKKRRKRRKPPARPTRRRASTTRSLSAARASSAGSGAVLREMASYRRDLIAQRDEIDAKIAKMEEAMSMVGGGAAGGGYRRAGGRRRAAPGTFRKGSVKNYIVKVLQSGGEMAVKDIAAKVCKVGYKTKSHNLPNQVSNALAQMADRNEVTKVGRGLFRL